MAHFRNNKMEFQRICAGKDWMLALDQSIGDGEAAQRAVGPLLALLPRPELSWQAAYGLGLAVSRMAGTNMESARIVMRRLMWSMNEESGNLGWGIPEAMSCILVESPALAREYSRILLSYGRDTGREDNFVEHAPLRRGVYWGIGRLAAADASLAKPALPHLISALGDEDAGVRGMAAFALWQLAGNIPAKERNQGEEAEQWRAAAQALEQAAANGTAVEFFDGLTIATVTLKEMLGRAREALRD